MNQDTTTEDATVVAQQRTRKRASYVVGALVGAVFIIRGVSALVGHSASPTCDASNVQDSFSGLVNQQLKTNNLALTFAKMEDIKGLGRSDAGVTCSSRVTLSDGSGGTFFYSVTPTEVKIDRVQ